MQQRWTELCKLALQRVLKCDIAKLPWQIIKYVKYSSHLVTAFSQENEPQKTAHSDSLKKKKKKTHCFYFEQHKWNSMNALVMEVKISEADISKPPQVKQQLCAWWTDPLISCWTAFVKSLSGVIWNKQPLHYGYRDAGTVTPTSNSNQERKTAHSVSVHVCVCGCIFHV